MYKHLSHTLCACAILLAACTGQASKKTAEPLRSAAFSADSAYQYIAEQVYFGPRVPGSVAHEDCAHYLTEQLRRFGASVSVQQGTKVNYAGQDQHIVNICGHFGPTDQSAVLLCAHWDCRPWADQEERYDDRMTPVLGANDGASGVGVLLEMARQLGLLCQDGASLPSIDIVFFDVEDMGTPDFYNGLQREDTWCLGSQLWSEFTRDHNATLASGTNNQKIPTYSYGILLDMVGSPNAYFPREYFSMQYAAYYVDKVWKTAEQLGYGHLFGSITSYPLTDDHYYINTIAGIPCIDIIHYDQRSGTGFPAYWHTRHDDMSNINKSTLDAVGKTVLTAILH